ncbi:MAG: WD40/YVTN/BNR-like repeat-containing protein, partial [bacterium]
MRLTYFWGCSYHPRAACNGDTVHLVWWEHYGVSGQLREEVFYKRSTDAGETWGEDLRLTPEDSVSAVTPSIAVFGNDIHVTWKETYAYYYAICYRRSADGGNSWGPIDTLHKTNMDDMWGEPSMCVIGDTVYLAVVRDDGNLLFLRSTNNGINWDSARVVGEGAAHPQLKISKSNHLILVASVDGSEIIEILFYKSFDGGSNWFDSQVVSEDDGIGSPHPAMDTDDSSG